MLVKSPVIMAMMMGSLVDLKEPGSGGKNGITEFLPPSPKRTARPLEPMPGESNFRNQHMPRPVRRQVLKSDQSAVGVRITGLTKKREFGSGGIRSIVEAWIMR
jgi:hypothetical protein